jgi:glycine dehydrogenase
MWTAVMAAALDRGINLRRVDDTRVGVSLDESSDEDLVSAVLDRVRCRTVGAEEKEGIPEERRRTAPLLEHQVFHAYRTEHEMLRYLRRLADRDLALDRSMIPLGSCTMKLNATTEMIPMTWPEFTELHPFVPLDQAEGYLAMIGELADTSPS